VSGTIFEDKELQNLLTHLTLPLKKPIPPKAKKKHIIVISGPTAVGKTKVSLLVASSIAGEIISADSMQVYKGMDIGTAKVSKEERQKIPHHLIDICELKDSFNVVQFYEAAYHAINDILERGKVPIVVGGTGFYLHALLYGPPSGPPSIPAVRLKLEEEMKEQGSAVLYEKLRTLDPDYAVTITQKDRHKIIRALEIISITNQKVSQFSKASHNKEEELDFRCWFLYLPKEALYPRIEARCDQMVQEGLIEEVKFLEKMGIRENSSASQAIGYRQCLEFLNTKQSKEDFEQFIIAFKQASRRYAKRQMTWFRKEPLFRWLDIEHMSAESIADIIIQDYELCF